MLGVFTIKELNALTTLCAGACALVRAQLQCPKRYGAHTALVAQWIGYLTTDERSTYGVLTCELSGHLLTVCAESNALKFMGCGRESEVVLRFGRGVDNPINRSSGKRDETTSRLTFRAAEDLDPFELAQLWADRTAWPIDERTQYDELSELAVMSALGQWLRLWQPMAIHSAMLAGARPEAVVARSATACKSPSIAGTSGRYGSR